MQSCSLRLRYHHRSPGSRTVQPRRPLAHIRSIYSVKMTYAQERRRSVFFCPEQQGRVQSHSIADGWSPQLSQPDSVVPHAALRHQRHAQNTIRQQQLHTFRHIRIKALKQGVPSDFAQSQP